MNKTIVGCKLLTADDNSDTTLSPPVTYPVGEWVEVSDGGTCIAIWGGLFGAGSGSVLAYFECREPISDDSRGITFFRVVKRLKKGAPSRIDPALRGEIAYRAPGLSRCQRFNLAIKSTPHWRGNIAYNMAGLSPDQRFKLALGSTKNYRGKIACYARGLTGCQRFELAIKSTPTWRGTAACYAPGLSPDQRFDLAMRSTQKWKRKVARRAPDLSDEQRKTCFNGAAVF